MYMDVETVPYVSNSSTLRYVSNPRSKLSDFGEGLGGSPGGNGGANVLPKNY